MMALSLVKIPNDNADKIYVQMSFWKGFKVLSSCCQVDANTFLNIDINISNKFWSHSHELFRMTFSSQKALRDDVLFLDLVSKHEIE